MQFSRIAFFCCAVLILFTGMFYYPKWSKPGSEATISWDVSGYYMYLPAAFIYKDLKKCTFKDSILTKYQPSPDFQQAFLHPSGNYVMKYPAGQAIMMLPFFIAAHLYAGFSDSFAADGFSYPYQLAISWGMLLAALIGIWYLRKILLEYFSDKATAITLLIIVFATNYLNYAAIDGAMTHNSLFTLYCLLIWTTIRFYKQPSLLKALFIGCFVGWVTLIRPTEIISILIPLLWGISSFADSKQRLSFFLKEFRYVFAVTVGAAAFIFIQLLYWKWSSGDWIVYSYQDQGFSWLHPHLYIGMFSSNNGWITYTPAIALFFFGLPVLYKKQKNLFWTVAVFSALFIYICFAWDIWWYGGSLGMRAMIQSYPVLAVSIAAVMDILFRKKIYLQLIVAGFLLICTYYNFWLTHQAHRGGLYRAGEMTDAYLKAILFQYKVDDNVQFLLDNTDRFKGTPSASSEIYFNNFDMESDEHATALYAVSGKSLFLNKEKQATPEYEIPVSKGTGNWLRISATFRTERKEWNTWRMAQFMVKFYKGNELVKYNMVRVFRVLQDNETKRIYFDAKIPDAYDRVIVSCWNADSDRPLLLDDLKVFLFEP
ncbi:MAG: glycosyltransferase family 39 protein [Chitinophagaceae bacterium]|nr:glycosyltransferase family 39 protein [Chitinophagaceae bacterium]